MFLVQYMGIVTIFLSVGVCHLARQRFFVIFLGVFGTWEDSAAIGFGCRCKDSV